MRRLLILLAVLFAFDARAAELLMVEEEWCAWCKRWHEEVGAIYDKTAESKRAPLRLMDIHDAVPKDITLASRPRFTPTFILIVDGQEAGRIEGYPGEDFFWGLLNQMLDRAVPAG